MMGMPQPIGRRQVLGGAFALAGVTTGAVAAVPGLASATKRSTGTPEEGTPVASTSPGPYQVVSFGWEVVNLHDNGADVTLEVLEDVILSFADVDVATMVTSLPAEAGFEEVLCQAAISRQAPPTYGPAPTAYLQPQATTDFGKATYYNPSNVYIVGNSPPLQDVFLSIILKSWVPLDGTASSTSRHIRTEPDMPIAQGDYLAFHMDHSGVEVDGEMQVVLGYRFRDDGT